MAARLYDHALVDLVLDDGGRHAAQVTQVGQGFALVRLLVADLPFTDVRGASLEVVAGGDVARVAGSATPADDAGIVRFCAEQGLGRRRFPRVPVDRECVLARADGSTCTGRVVDLSAGGMLVHAAGAVSLDELVGFALHRGGGEEGIEGHARCIRESVGGALAFEFESLSGRAEAELREIVAAELA